MRTFKTIFAYVDKDDLKSKFILLVLFLLILSLLSCSNPSSIRSLANNKKIISKTDNTQTENQAENQEGEQTLNNSKSEEFAELKEQIKSNSKSENNSDKEMKIPTLREQLKRMGEEQNIINGKIQNMEVDVKSIKNDVIEIKGTLEDIKSAMKILAGQKQAFVGEPIPENLSKVEKTPENLPKSDLKKEIKKEILDELKKEKNLVVENPPKITKVKKKILSDENISSKPIKETKSSKNEEIAQKSNPKQEQLKSKVEEIAQKPETVEYKTALNYISKKDYSNAIPQLQQAIKVEKDEAKKSDCRYWLGESHFVLKQYDKAIDFFTQVLKGVKSPKQDDAQVMLAESHIKAGQVNQAKNAFGSLITKFPDSEFVPRARKMLQQL